MITPLAQRTNTIRQSLLNAALHRKDNQPNLSLSKPTIEENAYNVELLQSPEACNPKWSAEDWTLINWVLKHFHDIDMPVAGKPIWNGIHRTLAQGPRGPLSLSGQFQASLRYLRQVIEQEQARRAQISTETKVSSDTLVSSRPAENPSPEGAIKSWAEKDRALIDWFWQLQPDELPMPPFTLPRGGVVTSNLFFEQLKEDVARGACGARAKTGALQSDLMKLKELVKSNPLKTESNVPQDDILDIENLVNKGSRT